MVYKKRVEENLHVCTECSMHFRISARERVRQTVDPNTFEEHHAELTSTDPLKFRDRIPYKTRLKEQRDQTDADEAVIVGKAYIMGRPIMLAAMDPFFIMGSMGAVVGEKVAWAAEAAADADAPFVAFACSGGARMQEGAVALTQMAKTSAAIGQLDDSKGLFISVMVDPCMAGVAASFAPLGDVILAEPNALIGFTGQRVIHNTIKGTLPDGFQRAEFMVEHGFVDRIVHRHDLRREIARLIDYCGK
jgi:acetyl-CoA carboxylase carboxyl transferase subunit beta